MIAKDIIETLAQASLIILIGFNIVAAIKLFWLWLTASINHAKDHARFILLVNAWMAPVAFGAYLLAELLK